MSSTINSNSFVSLLEGNAGSTGFSFTVTRTGDTTGPATVNYVVVPYFSGNTVNAADFQGGVLPSGLLSFDAGETSKTITLQVQGDSDVEPDEGFSLLLTNPTGGAIIGAQMGGGTIRADDGATLALSAAAAPSSEGNSGGTVFTFTATRGGDLAIAASANWTVSGFTPPFGGGAAADGADFVGGALPSGTVSFLPTQTTATFNVNVAGDTTFEPNEAFQVGLSNPSAGAIVLQSSLATTIVNDDGVVIAFAGQPSPLVFEGQSGTSTPMNFNVQRSGDTNVVASVNWSVNSSFSTATAADFMGGVLPSGSLTFGVGETLRTITLDIAGDSTVEANKTVNVALSGASANATIGSFSGLTGTILNDDPTSIAIAATDADKAEGASGNTTFTFTVTRSGDVSGTSSVNWGYSTTNIFNASLASAGDFQGGATPTGGTLTFNSTETTKTITVNVVGDTTWENDERFSITLSAPSNAIISGSSAFATIRNDDLPFDGTAGNDGVTANATNDLVRGLAGNDTLDGGAGDDTIEGGEGGDSLTGGLGADRFVLPVDSTARSTLANMDVILDFNEAQLDVLTFGGVNGTLSVNGAIRTFLYNADTGIFLNAAPTLGQKLPAQFHTTPTFQAFWLQGVDGLGAPEARGWIVVDVDGDEQLGASDFIAEVRGVASGASLNFPLYEMLSDVQWGTGFNAPLGTTGNDSLNGSGRGEAFSGTTGNDVLNGGAAAFNSIIYGTFTTPISVVITGPATATVIKNGGAQGTDFLTNFHTIITGSGADSFDATGLTVSQFYGGGLQGNGGNDTFIGGFRVLDDGSNFANVVVAYSAGTAAANINLELGTASDGLGGTDTLTNIRRLSLTSNFNDSVTGSAFSDQVSSSGNGNRNIDLGAGTGDRWSMGSNSRDVFFGQPITRVEVELGTGTSDGEFTGVARKYLLSGGIWTLTGTDILRGVEQASGGIGADSLVGSDANNSFFGGEGNDTINGGLGVDTVFFDNFTGQSYLAERGVRVNLTTGTATDAWGFTDTLISIESVYGTQLADDLTGVSVAGTRTLLRGLTGNDILRAPTLDTLVAADYRGDRAAVTVHLGTGLATDGWGDTDQLVNIQYVIGSRFGDVLTGGARDDLLEGSAGDDSLAGGAGGDIAIFTGARADYAITRDPGTSALTVSDTTAGRNGTDLLAADIETLRFSDGDVASASFIPTTAPVLALTALSAEKAEGNSGTTSFTFTVTRTGDTTGASSASWSVTSALATGDDFSGNALPTGLVNFIDGETTQTITVHVAGDTTAEADEAFTVTLTAPSGATLGNSVANGTILNEDIIATITGTTGNDTITPGGVSAGVTGGVPGNGDDVILGGAGRDSIDGGAGNDSIDAGTGNDAIMGGPGQDTLNANAVGAGDFGDDVSGGTEDDLLLGYISATGNLTNLNGGLGNDTINGYSLFENVADYAFYDRVSLVPRTEALVAVLGANGTATLGAEVDTLRNVVHIRGTNQSDSITGSATGEYFMASLGNDTVTGAGGFDRIEYAELTFAVNVNLTTNTGLKGAQTDTLSGIEDITGSNFNDTLVGDANSNTFRPIAGADSIDGRAGFDTVRYTTAFSTGGFGSHASGVTINLTTGTGTDNWGFTDTYVSIERADGSNLADDLTGKIITDTTTSGGSSDTQLRGLGGNDTLRAPQNDTRVFADYREDPGAVRINLSATDTVLGGVNVAARTAKDGYGNTDSFDKIQAVLGSNFNDTILGTDRADRLWGWSGDDVLIGGAGDDTLGGSAGVDSYTGGAGYDQVVFSPYNTTFDTQPTQGVVANLVTLTIANDGYGNAEVFAGGANDIEQLVGTNFGDDLTGARVNWNGAFGESQITYLRGGNGADSLRGVLADAFYIATEHLADADANNDGFGVTVNLVTQTAVDGWGNTDSLFNIGAARGSAFNDSLIGNDSDNWFRGEAGNDTIQGGLGYDTVSYRNSTASVNLDLASGVVQDGLGGVDSLSGIENVAGSAIGNDQLRGNAEANSLNGYGGDDVLEGRGGNDTLIGDTGSDTAVFSGARARYSITRDGTTGDLTVVDSLPGGDGTDLVRASVETLRFSDGDFPATLPLLGVLSITALSADKAEGNSGSTSFTFTVTRTGDSTGAASASWSVTGPGATGGDFAGLALPSDIVNFAPGQTSVTITVDVLADSTAEPDDGFTVTLSAPSNATLGTASANGIIRNDDFAASITGTAGNDTVSPFQATAGVTGGMSGAGPDTILGLGGDDYLDGGAGADSLDGGAGFDRLVGGEGNDTLVGGTGNDFFTPGAGDDSMVGGGDTGDVIIPTGATGPLTIDIAAGTMTGQGNDFFNGIVNAHGADFDDSISGSSANQYFFGRSGNDTIRGLGGDDNLIGDSGNDLLDGGVGFDNASFNDDGFDASGPSTRGVIVNLSGSAVVSGSDTVQAGTAIDSWGGRDTLVGVESASGSARGDLLIGDGLNNNLQGRAGDDTISGGAGNDFLTGGSGQDSIDGGEGTGDGVDYANTSDTTNPPTRGVIVNLSASTVTSGADTVLAGNAIDNWGGRDTLSGIENVIGSGLADLLVGEGSSNFLEGRAGDDTLIGGAGNDNLRGGSGNDSIDGGDGSNDNVDYQTDFDQAGAPTRGVIVNLSASTITAGADTVLAGTAIDGWGGRDTLLGMEDASSGALGDLLVGGGQNNNLLGRAGDDTLIGGGGNDNLRGGSGNDSINGGDGTADNADYTSDLDTAGAPTRGAFVNLSGTTVTVGADTVLAGTAIDNWGGRDTLSGIENLNGSGLGDLLIGNDANNFLGGSGGDDTLIAGLGSDFFNGGSGNDSMDGGEGTGDVVDYTSIIDTAGLPTRGVIVNISASAVVSGVDTVQAGTAIDNWGGRDSLVGIENVNGTALADHLIGDGLNNNLQGRAGDDTISGGAGIDFLTGGSGQDSIDGGEGTGDGVDYGNISDTTTPPTRGVIVNLSASTVTSGADTVLAGNAIDNWGGRDTLSGIENVTGSGLADFLVGEGSSNFLEGRAGDDTLIGGAGNDNLRGGSGNDSIDGGDGTGDNADYAGDFDTAGAPTRGAIVNLSGITVTVGADTVLAGTAIDNWGGRDTLSGIENLNGSALGDLLIGSDANNFLGGSAGNDTLRGGLGNDFFNGGSGNDSVDGGEGTGDGIGYLASFDPLGAATRGVIVNLSEASLVVGADTVLAGTAIDNWGGQDTLSGIENINGSALGDVLMGSAANNSLQGQEGDDSLTGGGGNDNLQGGTGNDVAVFSGPRSRYNATRDDVTGIVTVVDTQAAADGTDTVAADIETLRFSDGDVLRTNIPTPPANLDGTADADTLSGGSNNNLIRGFGGNDSLLGNGGDDTIEGGDGNDTLSGGDGNDSLDGGASDDTLVGGLGNDTLNGRTGSDAADYRNIGQAVTITLDSTGGGTATTLSAGTDTLIAIERIFGSAFADNITVSGNIPGWHNRVVGYGGNDTITGSATNTSFSGLPFVDYLNTGASFVTVNLKLGTANDGLGGTDTLINIRGVRATSGADSITGSDVNDRIAGRGGNDVLDGGAGTFDALDYGQAGTGVTVNFVTGQASDGEGGTDSFSNFEAVVGTNFADSIVGSAGNDFFLTMAGNDTVIGNGGQDRMDFSYWETIEPTQGVVVDLPSGFVTDGLGGTDSLTGITRVTGGRFADSIYGGAENNRFNGRGGNDFLDGGLGGEDYVEYSAAMAGVTVNLTPGTAPNGEGAVASDGEGGTDTLYYFEHVIGSNHNDDLTGVASVNGWSRLRGGRGDDTLRGIDGEFVVADYADQSQGLTVDLGTGQVTDSVLGTDTLFNIRGAFFFGNFDDTVTGTGFDEVFALSGGNDVLNAGGGRDTVSYSGSATNTLVINLATGIVQDGDGGTDTLTGVENAHAGYSNDTITGSDGDNVIAPGAGTDVVDAGAGVDTLDYSYGSSDGDIQYDSNEAGDRAPILGMTINLATGVAVDFGGFTDTVLNFENATGNIGADSIIGTAGDNRLTGGGGNDTLEGGGGTDTAAFSGLRSDYTITRNNATGALTVLDLRSASGMGSEKPGDGTDLLLADIEVLAFRDGNVLASSFAPAPVLSIAALSADKAEGNSGPTPFTFTVTRTGDILGASSVTWAVSGNGATASDFTGIALPTNTVSFAPGETSQTITVNVAGDITNEANEGFTVTLSAPTGAMLGTATATGTIRNDDTSIFSIVALSADKAEGNSGPTAFTFTVSREGNTNPALGITFTITGSGANPAAANDFNAGVLPTSTISFAAGEVSRTLTVNILGDTFHESAEGFTVTLSSANPAVSFATASAQGRIANDDPLTITGTAAPDTLTGTAEDELLLGLADNDVLDGGAGTDTLDGGTGNDTLLASAGADSLNGGAGVDTLLFGAAFAGVNLSLSLAAGSIALPDGLLSFANIENVTADSGNDALTGDSLANALNGGAGQDTLTGGLGNDVLTGGMGVDRFEVDAGTDGITDLGLGGADVLVVSAGATANATLAAAWTATAASSNAGTVNISASGIGANVDLAGVGTGGLWSVTNAGNATAVRFTGSVNADALTGGEGGDTLLGGAGDDTLSGNGGTDSLAGGAGDDSLNGGAGNDTLLGEADDDSLTGGAGDDRLTGGLGVDRFGVDAGTDTITDLGLGGADVLVVSAGATANATLAANWVLAAGNSQSGAANITAAGFSADLTLAAGSAGWAVSNLGTARAVTFTGSARNDTLTGGIGVDTLNGGGGNDSLLGDAGSDSLTGGAGNDSMTGGAGVDRFVVDAGTDTITDLASGGNDLLIVSAGAIANATLAGAWIASSNVANAGQVNITAGGFAVNLSAATGAATGIWSVTNAGQAAAVVFTGSALRDRLTGGLGQDSLVGGAEDDTLTGGDARDTLLGGAGVDSLVGGAGDDLLTGGADLDRFLVEAGTDTITDLGFGGPDALIILAGATANATIGGHWTASAGSNNGGSANLVAAGFNVDLSATSGTAGWALSNAGHARGIAMTGSANADTITGGNGADTMRGGAGPDSLNGSAGNDQLFGGAGNDTMTGGAGIDRFAVDAGTDVITDLAAGGVDILIVSAGATAQATLAADWVATSASSNVGVANLTAGGFDVSLAAVLGTAGWNVSNAGDANAVALTGSARADVLTGGSGADTLSGGAGNDTLIGSAGADNLNGGLGADSFRFDSAGDAMGDVITGFTAAEADKLDLRLMDANAALDGEQAFIFLGGGAFTATAGQLRFAGGLLEGDLDGNGVSDFQIQMTGVASLAVGSIWL